MAFSANCILFRMLTVIYEYTRECLATEVGRHIRSGDVLHVLTDLFTRHGEPDRDGRTDGPRRYVAEVSGLLCRRRFRCGSRNFAR